MHGSRNKIPIKKSRQAALRGGFNSGVKGLILLPHNCLYKKTEEEKLQI
jgi:hypothetical protein